MKVLALFFVFISTILFGSIWGGYVLSVLWGWFIIPVFHLPSLSIGFAIGIQLVVGLFTAKAPQSSQKKSGEDSEMKDMITAIVYTFLYPGFALLLGALLHIFVH